MKNFKKNNHGLSYRSPKLELYFSWLAVGRYMRCVKKLRLFDYFLMACAFPFILVCLITFVIFPFTYFSCHMIEIIGLAASTAFFVSLIGFVIFTIAFFTDDDLYLFRKM